LKPWDQTCQRPPVGGLSAFKRERIRENLSTSKLKPQLCFKFGAGIAGGFIQPGANGSLIVVKSLGIS